MKKISAFNTLAALVLSVVMSLAPLVVHAQSTLNLTVGMYRIQAEVMNTEPTRERGLMYRTFLPQSQGMLFVFPTPAANCMWMKNTLLPLSVAFIDDSGRIINIEEMAPQTENNHCAARPARYALEMNANWFRQRGFGPGMLIDGIDRAPGPQ